VTLISTLLDLVYPRLCAGCGGRAPDDGTHICWDCAAGFPLVEEPHCSRCGDPVDGRVENIFECSLCRRRGPHFDLARAALRYRAGVKDAIHSLKYRRMTCLSRDLAGWLIAAYNVHYATLEIDAVTCVPLYPRRQRDRSYNQAALLGGELASGIGVPLASRCLERVRATASQIDLSAGQRRANVRNAFAVRGDGWVEGRRLLLVDDVMTTGATVDECSRVLKKAGAAGVYVLTVARG